jgi:hypothetical protein
MFPLPQARDAQGEVQTGPDFVSDNPREYVADLGDLKFYAPVSIEFYMRVQTVGLIWHRNTNAEDRIHLTH